MLSLIIMFTMPMQTLYFITFYHYAMYPSMTRDDRIDFVTSQNTMYFCTVSGK